MIAGRQNFKIPSNTISKQSIDIGKIHRKMIRRGLVLVVLKMLSRFEKICFY